MRPDPGPGFLKFLSQSRIPENFNLSPSFPEQGARNLNFRLRKCDKVRNNRSIIVQPEIENAT